MELKLVHDGYHFNLLADGKVLEKQLNNIIVISARGEREIESRFNLHPRSGFDNKTLEVNVKTLKRRRNKTKEDAFILLRSGYGAVLYLKETVLAPGQFDGPFVNKVEYSHQAPFISSNAVLCGVNDCTVLETWNKLWSAADEEYKRALWEIRSIYPTETFEERMEAFRKAQGRLLSLRDAVNAYTVEDYLQKKELLKEEQ